MMKEHAMNHRAVRSLGILLIALALAACGQAPAGGGQAADSGGQTPSAAGQTSSGSQTTSTELSLLCTPQVEWCEGMKAEFEKANPGVTVNFVRLSSGEALTRLRNEKDNPQFDIWWGGPVDSFIAAKQEGLIEKYDSPKLSGIKDPKLLKDAENYWAGIYVGSLGFATNTKYLAEHPGLKAPTSWDDLLKPEWKGQVLVAHPSSSGTSYTALCTVLQMRGADAGWEFMRKLNDNVLQYTKSGAAPAKFVGSGEAAVGIVFSHDIVAAVEGGSPLQLTFPAEGTGYEIGGMAILKNAKHADVAKKWFDWALEPATQELGPKYKAYQAPTVNGAKASRPELLEVKLIDYNFDQCGKDKKANIDRFTNEIAGADKLKE
jgi:iron(III) transport system substrate-binding protein